MVLVAGTQIEATSYTDNADGSVLVELTLQRAGQYTIVTLINDTEVLSTPLN